jgi:hypothetical protein
MAAKFQDAHDRFEENVQLLLDSELREKLTDKQQFETVLYNVSAGLRNLTEALKSEHDSIHQILDEIKRDLPHRG